MQACQLLEIFQSHPDISEKIPGRSLEEMCNNASGIHISRQLLSRNLLVSFSIASQCCTGALVCSTGLSLVWCQHHILTWNPQHCSTTFPAAGIKCIFHESLTPLQSHKCRNLQHMHEMTIRRIAISRHTSPMSAEGTYWDPWDDASQVCADSVEAVLLNGVVCLDCTQFQDHVSLNLNGDVLMIQCISSIMQSTASQADSA